MWMHKQNKQKLRFLGNGTRMLEQIYKCMSSAYIHKLDHVYADPYPKNLINTETEQKPNKT